MLISVTRQIGYAIILAAALFFAACRQADGPTPEASGTVANELGDISRDLQNLASGDPAGKLLLHEGEEVLVLGFAGAQRDQVCIQANDIGGSLRDHSRDARLPIVPEATRQDFIMVVEIAAARVVPDVFGDKRAVLHDEGIQPHSLNLFLFRHLNRIERQLLWRRQHLRVRLTLAKNVPMADRGDFEDDE